VIEGLGWLVRALHVAGALLLFGTLVCLHLPARADQGSVARWRRYWLRIALLLSVATLVLGVGVLAAQVTRLDAQAAGFEVARRLLGESRFGAVWLTREALLLITSLLLASQLASTAGEITSTLALIASGAALAIAPLSGHSAAIEPALPVLTAHAVHLLAAGAWWGALPALAMLLVLSSRGSAERGAAVNALARFSSLALPLMGAIILTGALLAVTHVERWPALLATRYGYLLLAKLLFLMLVLAMAARLRWRMLPALQAGADARVGRRCAQWIVAECLVASGIVLVAAQLAQTVPARHDAIAWWLPFRFSVAATWDTPWTPARVWSGAALLVVTLLLIARALLHRAQRASGLAMAALLALSAAAIALPALSVDAYPDTYRNSSVAFQTISVAAGAELFAAHCVSCHGATGHGDGPLAKGLQLPPADLTAPHTALHTAGDLFWWLTHGKAPGVMPGFAGELGEDDRWDLINFLRTLSSGYQARILDARIARMQPWLAAVDFAFTSQRGEATTLKDYRGRNAVLLVFFSQPDSQARLEQLARGYAALRDAGVEVIAVPVAGDRPTAQDLPFPLAVEGAGETARAYALLRRTLSNADPRDSSPLPSHMEMLIDRFGYIRARWLAGDGEGWHDLASLTAQLAALAREPQIKPPPDDHVH
jgi:putative copper export protein/mono/diheme cytochrome c family protein/peroxiredoxin